MPNSYCLVSRFGRAAGSQPNLVLDYAYWGEPFVAAFARTAAAHGAVVVIGLDPTGPPVLAVAAGRQDGYLPAFASAVRAFGGPVVILGGHRRVPGRAVPAIAATTACPVAGLPSCHGIACGHTRRNALRIPRSAVGPVRDAEVIAAAERDLLQGCATPAGRAVGHFQRQPNRRWRWRTSATAAITGHPE